MAAPNTTEPASPWVGIQEFTKNVVTLAGALVGLTVTFASQLLGKADSTTRTALYVAWAAAVIAIALGVAGHGKVIAYLKNGKGDWWAVLLSNLSFWALVVAALAFAMFGYFAVEQSSLNSAVAIARNVTTSAPALSGDIASRWSIKSLKYEMEKGTYEITVAKELSSETARIVVNSSGVILSFQRP